jgi:hypothetical protein
MWKAKLVFFVKTEEFQHIQAFLSKVLSSRVARWYIFISIWAFLVQLWNGQCWHSLCPFGLFYSHLEYFTAIWVYFVVIRNNLPRFGMLSQEKSGNRVVVVFLCLKYRFDWAAKLDEKSLPPRISNINTTNKSFVFFLAEKFVDNERKSLSSNELKVPFYKG